MMLTSLALILLCGLLLGRLFGILHLPALVGMLVTGMILGPYALDCFDASILRISPDLRQLALVVILTRAGLSIDVRDLQKIGRPAVLLCFVPACCEIIGIVLLTPPLLGLSYIEAALLGSVVAAVSPAVVVPRMLRLMEDGYGRGKAIPQLIMAGASVDDIFVIVLFSSFVSLVGGGEFTPARLGEIPVSIITGAAAGALFGLAAARLFKAIHMRDSVKVVIVLSVSLLLLAVEKDFGRFVPFSGLLAIMCMGGGILEGHPDLAARLSAKYSKLWIAAEVMLFVLVGAGVDVKYALSSGAAALVVLVAALLFRMAGVYVCVLGTELSARERLFCMIAYVPKATVQAAIGGIPLALGLPCGKTVLTVAVLSILVTAPLGALGIDFSFARLLVRDGDVSRA